MAGMVHVVLRHQLVLIVKMRILEFLMPLRARLNGMFRVFAHGFHGESRLCQGDCQILIISEARAGQIVCSRTRRMRYSQIIE
jgi:hypothetical protein